LQRKHIKEATVEADTQNLINTNKTLKAKLVKANDLYAQLKKETLTSRSQSKKWESDLSAKVRSYRDSEKNWFSEEDKLRCELQKTQSDYEHLKTIVEQAEAERLKAQQREEALANELKDYENVREELEATQQKIMAYEDQTKELHALFQERVDLRNDLEVANMRLNSREVERERSVKAYERRIMALEQRLHVAEKAAGGNGQLSSIQQKIDSALAASNAKLQSMKKTHHRLVEQHTELQMKYQDLEAEHQAALGQFHVQGRIEDSEFEQPQLSRTSSLQQANSTHTRTSHPLSAEVSLNEERGYFPDYASSSLTSPPSSIVPISIDSPPPPRPQRSHPGPSFYPAFGGGLHPDYSATQSSRPTTGVPQSSAKSSFSVDTESSGGREQRDKVDPKSDVRVYGRGE
jgi:hypothetical protein